MPLNITVTVTVTVNNNPCELPANATVADALAAIQAKLPYAVAVNTAFVPAAQHASHQLQDGDRLEVISPVTGG